MLVPIFHEVLAATGLARADIGFWCSGSSDYLAGRAFSFVAALQARLGMEAGLWTEKDMAQVAVRSRAAALANPAAQVSGRVLAEDLLAEPYVADPLRAHDCAPVGDGAAVVVLASAERARDLSDRPAWITGFEHRIDSGPLGERDLTTAPSAAAAGPPAGARHVDAAD